MTYTILKSIEQKTIITSVEYTFDNGDILIIDVSHFEPKSDEDIIIGIENRGITEQNNINNSN